MLNVDHWRKQVERTDVQNILVEQLFLKASLNYEVSFVGRRRGEFSHRPLMA
jgi:hypothetical protein